MTSYVKESIINLFYMIGNTSIGKMLSKKYTGDASILMYHRVHPFQENQKYKASLSISTRLFEEHMRFISDNYTPISIDDLSIHSNSNYKSKPIVLTFDDGYKDNLTCALPILEKYKIPAVIYITTCFPEINYNMWWYELADLIEDLSSLTLNSKFITGKWSLKTEADKTRCYKDIHSVMMNLSPEKQIDLMKIIRGNQIPKDYSGWILSWNEIIELDRHPLITIGAHTHTHAVLSTQTSEKVEDDIKKSITLLESKLGHKVEHFAYPMGELQHANEREYRIAEKLNLKTAVTTIYGNLNCNSSLYALPRIATKRRTTITHLKAKFNGWNSLFKGIQI